MGRREILLKNCWFVITIFINLISARKLDSKGCTVRLQTSNFAMFKGKKVVLKGLFNNALFSIDNPENVGEIKYQMVTNISQGEEILRELHNKLGRPFIQRIEPLLKNSISTMEKRSFVL